MITTVCGSLPKLSPPVFQYSFSPTLEQLVELQFELLSLRLFRVSPWTVYVDHSNSLLFVLTPVGRKDS